MEEVHSGRLFSKRERPGVDLPKQAIKANASLLTHEYLNPDPWVHLKGESNETQVKVEGQTFKALIDSGAVVSQITQSLAKTLGLKNSEIKENNTYGRGWGSQCAIYGVCGGFVANPRSKIVQ